MKAYAKINLALDIIGKRADGYHELATVMQRISLSDDITLAERADGVRIRCDTPGVPKDERNIVWKAADAFSRYTGIDVKHICFIIEKHIPDGAGLGGGSSDGAAALILLDEHFDTRLTTAEKTNILTPVGADIPFFLYGGTALCEGIGERVTPLQPLAGYCVLVKPSFSVSTPQAYAAYDASPAAVHPDVAAMCAAICAGDLRRTAALIGNVLQPCAEQQFPYIKELERQLMSQGALGARMTGSGSAVFGIFEDAARAKTAADALYAPGLSVFCCAFC